MSETKIITIENSLSAREHFRTLHSLGTNSDYEDENELQRYERIITRCNDIIARDSSNPSPYYERGIALVHLKRHEEALESFDHAIQIQSRSAEYFYWRGLVFGQLNRLERGLDDLYLAIEVDSKLSKAYFLAGSFLFSLNHKSKAVSFFEKAVEHQPNHAAARIAACVCELPILYEDESEILECRLNYEKKVRTLCADFDAGRLTGDLVEAIGHTPFYLAYQQYCDRDLQSLYGRLICGIMGREFSPASLPSLAVAGERVRVGFVSAFFSWHSNWDIPIKGWLSQLDRRRFRLFGYHLGKHYDGETSAAAFMCERFVHGLNTISDYREEILADAPHVLIYPGLWMDPQSIKLASQRLAPVQCNSLGHPDTSGMPTIDYYISSQLMEPDNGSEHYSENLVTLPNLSVYYFSRKSTNISKNFDRLGLKKENIKYWCGQSLFKFLPQYDHIFPCIASAVKDCQFVFIEFGKGVTKTFERRLQRVFTRYGLDYTRYCLILPRLQTDEFSTAVSKCDVALDSIGWSGHNTTVEYLEHDIPIVTLEGRFMRGRHTSAILGMMGLTETTARTIEEYVSISVNLGKDPSKRAAIRRFIAENKHRVFRDRECISALEDFLDRVGRQEPIGEPHSQG